MQPKLCINCKHYRTAGNGACEEHPVCASPRNGKDVPDLVRGGTRRILEASWCEHQRAIDEPEGDRCQTSHCGRQGWWHEPKPETLQDLYNPFTPRLDYIVAPRAKENV